MEHWAKVGEEGCGVEQLKIVDMKTKNTFSLGVNSLALRIVFYEIQCFYNFCKFFSIVNLISSLICKIFLLSDMIKFKKYVELGLYFLNLGSLM